LGKKKIDWLTDMKTSFIDFFFILSLMPFLLLMWGLIKIADIKDYLYK